MTTLRTAFIPNNSSWGYPAPDERPNLQRRMRGERLRYERGSAIVRQQAPVQRVRRHRDVVLLVEEDHRFDAARVRVIDVVERLLVPLVLVPTRRKRSEFADHDR